jgi:hypothetical protein
MALTCTGSLSAAESGRAEIRTTMLVGAIRCNLAWGFDDAVMYRMGCLAAHGAELSLSAQMRSTRMAEEARDVLVCALPAYRRPAGCF